MKKLNRKSLDITLTTLGYLGRLTGAIKVSIVVFIWILITKAPDEVTIHLEEHHREIP